MGRKRELITLSLAKFSQSAYLLVGFREERTVTAGSAPSRFFCARKPGQVPIMSAVFGVYMVRLRTTSSAQKCIQAQTESRRGNIQACQLDGGAHAGAARALRR